MLARSERLRLRATIHAMSVFDLEAELRAVTSAFHASGIEYAVCGGIAVAIHGHPRATMDIDLFVHPSALSTIRQVLEAVGYTLAAAPMAFSSGVEVQRISRIADGELFTVDLLLASDALEKLWAEREQISWQGTKLWVVSRTALAEMKRLAGRKQDLADLEALGESSDG